MKNNVHGVDNGYGAWKREIRAYKGIDIDNDDTYDYESFYNEDPEKAWAVLDEKSDAHFSDKYKTARHPTFSNESVYSGRKHERHNPGGIEGGTWHGDYTYQMSKSQEDAGWDYGRTQRYLADNESRPVTFLSSKGEKILREVEVTPERRMRNYIDAATKSVKPTK